MSPQHHLELVNSSASIETAQQNTDVIAEAARLAVQSYGMVWDDPNFEQYMAVAMEAAAITQRLIDENEAGGA